MSSSCRRRNASGAVLLREWRVSASSALLVFFAPPHDFLPVFVLLPSLGNGVVRMMICEGSSLLRSLRYYIAQRNAREREREGEVKLKLQKL